MLIERYREKLINAIIYFVNNTKYCGKTKLFKLLYYLDFIHFRETGRSVTGMDYVALPYGPVPCSLKEDLESLPPDLSNSISVEKVERFNIIRAKQKFDDEYFSRREMKILENVAFIFKEAKAENMTEASHLPNEPWDKTIKNKGKNKKIDYFLALDDSRESLSREEVIDRIKDREEIEKIFNE